MWKHSKTVRRRAPMLVLAAIAAASCMFSVSPANATFCAGPGYVASQVLDATNNVVLEWSVCGAGIDFQLSANTTGWIGLAWGPVAPGPLDAVQGKVEFGTSTVRDAYFSSFFGWVHTNASADSIQNLSDTGGSESAGVTTIRFSRLLDTGDSAEDMVLSANVGDFTTFYWGLQTVESVDMDKDLIVAQGYTQTQGVALSAGISRAGAVPEPATLALLGLGLAGIGFLRRRLAD